MLEAIRERFAEASVLVMSAAVADWRAKEVLGEKQPKLGERQTIELVRTPDILSELSKQSASQVMVGFAMETHTGVERAADKARRKGLDFICLNYPAREHTAFGGDDNEVTFVTPEGEAEALPLLSKLEVAERILDRVASLLAAGNVQRSDATG